MNKTKNIEFSVPPEYFLQAQVVLLALHLAHGFVRGFGLQFIFELDILSLFALLIRQFVCVISKFNVQICPYLPISTYDNYYMIKLVLNLSSNGPHPKVLVNINSHQQVTVQEFLDRVVLVCELDSLGFCAEDLELYDGEFLMPNRLPSYCLDESKMYTLVNRRSPRKERLELIKNKDKKQARNSKKEKKQRKALSSDESSSSELQSYNFHGPKNKKINGKQEKKPQKCQKSVQIKQKVNHKTVKKTVQSKIRAVAESSDSQQSSPVTMKQTKIEKKHPVVHKQVENQAKSRIKNVPLAKPKVVSDSSSEEEEMEPQQYKKKVNEILANIHSKPKAQKQPELPKRPVPQKKPLSIPISVRKKPQKSPTPHPHPQAQPQPQKQPSPFKQHKQQKWLPITKEILTNWATSLTDCIVGVKNQIRFKIMELDQEKFVPVNSGWITGFVSGVRAEEGGGGLVVGLVGAVKEGRTEMEDTQFFPTYEIPFHNMQELQINKNTLTEAQKAVCLPHPSDPNPKNPQPEPQPQPQVQPQPHPQQPQKPQQSLQDFIRGQCNYYFSDKNYPTDLFMQMHANSDPGKYINIKLMLNFPKIKKFLSDEQKLWQYLTTDQRYGMRNYELDWERRMIRRKG